MMGYAEYKLFVFLTAFFAGGFFIRKYGPIVLLYFASFFCWHAMTLNSWGPFDFFLKEMSFSDIAIGWAFFYAVFLRRRIKIPYLKLLLIFFVSSLIPWFLGNIPEYGYAWIAMRQCVILPIMAYVVIIKIVKTEGELKNLIWCFLGGSVLLALVSLMAALGYFGPPLAADYIDTSVKEYRFFTSYRIPILGSMTLGGNLTTVFAAFAVPYFINLLLSIEKKTIRVTAFLLSGFALNLSVILISGSRTPLIAVIISIGVIYFLVYRKNPITNIGKVIAACFLGVTIYLFFQNTGLISIGTTERFVSLSYAFRSPYAYFQEYSGGRYQTWGEFIPTLVNHPFGAGFMESFAPIGGADVGPHAQYLLLLLGTGVIGMLIYFLFVFISMWKGFMHRPMNYRLAWIKIGTGGAILTYFFSAFMVHTILVHGADFMLFILCGIGMKMTMLSNTQKKGQRLFIRW